MLHVRHRLGTAGHHHAGGTRGNLSRSVEHGLQTRTAAAVDLQSRHAGAQARVQRGDPADGRCLTAGVSVAEDDVVDVALTETGPLNKCPQGHRGQLGRSQRRQRTAHPANRSAHRIADDDVQLRFSKIHDTLDLNGAAVAVIATVLPVVADSAAALAKTRAATPSSKDGEQGSPVRMECANASSSARYAWA